MNKIFSLSYVAISLWLIALPARAAPKLIVVLVGDQVRADYLERFHNDLVPEGLRRFRDEGTYYANARQDHGVTKTSPGHTLIGSGQYAKDSGIVNNEWYDTASHKMVSAAELILGGKHTELRWFMGTSLAQRVHNLYPDSHVIGVSYKDRAALLLSGPDQDEAYWRDNKNNDWISYLLTSPLLQTFDQAHPIRVKTKPSYEPYTDEITEELAEAALGYWKLGHNPAGPPDVLSVSFSAVDLVGHQFGPDSAEVKDAFLRLDHMVAKLVKAIESEAGDDVVYVFSSDHGVTPLPEISKANGLAAGRVPFKKESLPHPEWIAATAAPFIYMSHPEFILPLKEGLEKMTGVQAVYTSKEIASCQAPIEVQRDFYPGRCGDLWVVLKPHYIFSASLTGTTHGQPTDDDERVPLGFYGPGFPAQVHSEPASVAIVNPTLLKILSQ